MRIDTRSATWIEIEAYLRKELQRLRERNDKNINAIETAHLRGEIKAVRGLLDLPSQVTQVPKDDPGYSTTSLDD
jgi:hypothetical protein